MDVLSKEELVRNRLSTLNMEAQNIRVDLQEPELWSKFYEKTNEMIVTKNGRRMFPVIKAGLGGLEPNTFYKVKLEFKQIEKNRWKYINGDWLAGNDENTVYQIRTSFFIPNRSSMKTKIFWASQMVGFYG